MTLPPGLMCSRCWARWDTALPGLDTTETTPAWREDRGPSTCRASLNDSLSPGEERDS